MKFGIWTVMLAFIPLFVFWIIQKILRIKLYTYKARHYPKEYKHFGYRALGLSYISVIFKNPHPDDKHYTTLLKQNRMVFILLLIIIVLTAYIVYLYI